MDTRPRTTLPARAYHDPELFEREVTELFGRAWTLVGHVSELAEPGAYATVTIGREPVIVVRGDDGVLRALSNVCRHRASLLKEGSGTSPKVLRCPYHGWTYKLDGRLAGVPHGRGFCNLDRDAVRLPAYRVGEMAGLVFACTDPDAPSIEDAFGDVAGFLSSLHLERRVVFRFASLGRGPRRLLLVRRADRYAEDYQANWKILAENYQEDYHVPVGHPSLVRLLDIKNTEGHDGALGEYSWVPLRTTASKKRLERVYQRLVRPMPDMPPQFSSCWGNAYLWPATFFEIYPHHIDTWQLFPIDMTTTRAVTMTLVDPTAGWRDRLARTLTHRLQADVMSEDTELTDRVQVGLSAPSYESGILNDKMESSVIRFQDMIRSRIPEEGNGWPEG